MPFWFFGIEKGRRGRRKNRCDFEVEVKVKRG
jgi:hypothetical protein